MFKWVEFCHCNGGELIFEGTDDEHTYVLTVPIKSFTWSLAAHSQHDAELDVNGGVWLSDIEGNYRLERL